MTIRGTTEKITTPLKPCPFCGSEFVRAVVDTPAAMPGSIVSYAYVECTKCHAKGPSFDDWMKEKTFQADAIKAWNRMGEK